jgi:hypothetical protein
MVRRFFQIAAAIFISVCLFGCLEDNESTNRYLPGDFCIFLKGTNELVISGEGIKEYRISKKNFEQAEIVLNDEGIKLINNFAVYDSPVYPERPNYRKIYMKEFVVKLKGREVYSGIFYSAISSAIPPGIVIEDVMLSEGIRNLGIHKSDLCNTPVTDLINGKEILEYFSKFNKLVYIE